MAKPGGGFRMNRLGLNVDRMPDRRKSTSWWIQQQDNRSAWSATASAEAKRMAQSKEGQHGKARRVLYDVG